MCVNVISKILYGFGVGLRLAVAKEEERGEVFMFYTFTNEMYPKSYHDNGSKPSSDDGKKVDEDPRKKSEYNDLEKEDNVNNTNNVNASGPNEVNVVGGKTSIELPFDPNMLALEDVGIFDFSNDDEDDGAISDMNYLDTTIQVSPIPTTRIYKDHHLNQVIGDLQSATQTRKMSKNLEGHGFVSTIQQRTNHKDLQNCLFTCFLSQEEPKKALNGFSGTKRIKRGIVIRNKVRFVAQGYTQEEGIDYDEVFSPVARIEAIRLFLAYASFKDFVVYQMDVKSDFLYGKIEEEVYVCQPPGFEDPDFPDRVYKVEKAWYGLHQAPRAWYKSLSTYLLDNRFQRGKTNKTLFIKRHKGDILLISFMGELTFFLGLQVKQKKDDIFISQDKYVAEILKKFGFTEVKTGSTPMKTQKPLLKDEDGKEVDVHMYRSMIGSLMYLTSSRHDIMFAVCACARYQVNLKVSHLHTKKRIFRLISWQCKKQTVVANSTTDAEYFCTAMAKTIDEEVQLHALVDGKEIVITESSVRRDLRLANEEGVDYLPNSTIFEQLALMGMIRNLDNVSGKILMYPRFLQIFLDQQLDGVPTHKIFGNMRRLGKGFSGRVTPLFPTMVIQNQSELGEDEAVHKELGDSLVRAATTASSLEAEQDSGNITKTRSKATPNESSSQGTNSGGGPGCQETMGDTIAQTRVLDLEKTKTTQQKEIDSLKRRVKKLEKRNRSRTHKLKRLYKGRIDAIDADEEITLVNVQDDADKEMFDVDALNGEEVFVAEQEVVNAATTTTATIMTVDDVTLAQALMEIKSTKLKEKWIVFQKPGKSTTTTTKIIYSQQSWDKGKGIMIEEPVKKKHQIMLDAEAAKKLQAEFDEEERLAREKSEKEKEDNITLIEEWDDIQAKIDADHQSAERMQAQEQEELSDAEKATLFQQLLEKRRKHFAAKRAEEKRNKPPTKAQQRKIMCTYLKNMEGYKLKDLKLKEFDSIQEMFDRVFKRVNTFEDFRTELVKGKEKRSGEELIQESTKKQKVEDDKETTELKKLMKITPDEEEVAIDAIPLAINQMLKEFDKEDLVDLYKLVKAKHESTRPVEDLNLFLWGDLKTMFEPHVEDEVWKKKQGYKVLERKLYDSCEVHSLMMQSMKIYMLVEKKYPLTPPTLSMMLGGIYVLKVIDFESGEYGLSAV
ncbi:putative ribonuclease H-like domain-containing protein [Tanacetum coccineum]